MAVQPGGLCRCFPLLLLLGPAALLARDRAVRAGHTHQLFGGDTLSRDVQPDRQQLPLEHRQPMVLHRATGLGGLGAGLRALASKQIKPGGRRGLTDAVHDNGFNPLWQRRVPQRSALTPTVSWASFSP